MNSSFHCYKCLNTLIINSFNLAHSFSAINTYLTAAKPRWELMGGHSALIYLHSKKPTQLPVPPLLIVPKDFLHLGPQLIMWTIQYCTLAFVPVKTMNLFVFGHWLQLMGVQRRSEKPGGLEVAWGTRHEATKVGYFPEYDVGAWGDICTGRAATRLVSFISMYVN